MSLQIPQPGQVIRSAYLWADEHARGLEEGLKDRPCVVVISLAQADGEHRLIVLPVTHSAPVDPAAAIELPAGTKGRLGLDAARSWIVLNEANRFTWPGPDIRPFHDRTGTSTVIYGFLPPRLFRQVRDRLQALALTYHIRQVPRTE